MNFPHLMRIANKHDSELMMMMRCFCLGCLVQSLQFNTSNFHMLYVVCEGVDCPIYAALPFQIPNKSIKIYVMVAFSDIHQGYYA